MGTTSSTSVAEDEGHHDRELAAKKLRYAPFFPHLGLLAKSLDGPVITPNERDAYMSARKRPHNQDMRGFPLVIVRAKNTSDVVKVITFVKQYGEGVKLCIACGGHSNRCMRTDSFVLDLMEICDVDIDVENQTAAVGGGAYLEALDLAMAPHNFGTTLGTFPWTGVGGLTLAGGYGWLGRLYGLSVDNLLEVELVLADGTVVVANDTNEHASLIWGCRGGGGNFGVVTKFVFKIHKLPPYCHGGEKVFLTPTVTSALNFLKNYDRMMQNLPTRTSAAAILVGGASVVPTMWGYFGDIANVADVPEFGRASRIGGWTKLKDTVRPISYHHGIQKMTTPYNTSGLIYTTLIPLGSHSELLPDEFFPDILSHTRKSIPKSLAKAIIILFPMGGTFASSDEGHKTSVNRAARNARYMAIVETNWSRSYGVKGKQDARAWAQESVRILSKYNTTGFMHASDSVVNHDNFLGWDDDTWQKLVDVKTRYDPTNFFNQNANILPSSQASDDPPEVTN